MMKTVKLIYKMQPGTKKKFLDDIYGRCILEKTRNEKGCISYDFYSSCDRDEILLIEKWENDEALEKHIEMPHLKELRKLKDEYKIETVPAEI